MTRSKLIAATVATVLIAGAATAAPTESFTHEGVTYAYSVRDKGKMRIIEGFDQTNRRSFRFRVSDRWVDGTVDGNPVSFPLSEVKPVTALRATTDRITAR
jgi:hypothetical protein